MNAAEEARILIEFAKEVLAILHRDEEWDSETISDIGHWATDLGLGEDNEDGRFRAHEDYLP